jgi:hypothetical protein
LEQQEQVAEALRPSLVPNAGELAESIAAGHRQGIALELFPQPRILQGTVGVELESGYMFFQPEELRKFWESQDAGAESETDSILAADEEGLGHLHVQVSVIMKNMPALGKSKHLHADSNTDSWLSMRRASATFICRCGMMASHAHCGKDHLSLRQACSDS